MKHHISLRILLVVSLAWVLAAAPRAARAATPEEVDAAVKKAVAFLYTQQNKDGNWEIGPKAQEAHNWGGYTALATYALLASGESHQDPRIMKGIDFLLKEQIIGTYALGLRCQVWNLLAEKTGGVPNAVVRAARDRDGQFLLASVGQPPDPDSGLYDYSASPTRIGPRHNSPSQYGVLGMWALDEIGFEVPLKYWELVDKAWKRDQANDGGWAYMPKVGAANPVKASMTAAGVASLFITNDYLHSNDGIACHGNITNDNIEQGLQWMSKHFDQGLDLYTLYGVERIGVASGYKYFGKTPWFAVGAETLVRGQAPSGAWEGFGPIPGTSFGLLFLSRGRAAVAINKLDYETGATKGAARRGPKPSFNWNERPRDVANAVRWIGRHIEQDLNWQVVNFTAPIDDLHDAPILYISGDGALNFTEPEQAILRQFVEQGGMILGNADCAKQPFVLAFKKLGTTLFPKYEFRELPESHPIYVNEQFQRKKWKLKPKVQGLSNGVRELMILVPDADPARAWQTRSDVTRKELYELASDIFLYSIDKTNLQVKGLTHIVKDLGVAPQKTIKVVRLLAGDNPDPEPGGWRRLGNVMKNQDKVALAITTSKLAEGTLAGAKVADLTGTTSFTLSDSQRDELKQFVAKGGTLIVDAAGGSTEFGDAAEAELRATFGDDAVKGLPRQLPADHLIYNVPGHPIKEVKYRAFSRAGKIGKLNLGHISGITVGDRVAVFFSREDLAGGLVGEQVDGVLGYDPATATAIVRNLLLYADVGGKFPKPVTQPATTGPTTQPATAPATQPATPPATQPAATQPAIAPAATG